MFSIHDWKGTKTRDISQRTLNVIWRGVPGGREACNMVHVYGTWWDRDPEEWIDHVLEPIARFNRQNPDAHLQIIIGTLYEMFVDIDPSHNEQAIHLDHRHAWKNHYLNVTSLKNFIEALIQWDHDPASDRGVIAGWYAFDEPNENGYDLHEYYKLIDVLKKTIGDDHSIYGDISPDIVCALGTEEPPPPRGNGFRHIKYHWINWDGRILEADDPRDRQFIVDEDRFPSRDGTYQGRWYFTQWPCDVLLIDYYKPYLWIPHSEIIDYYKHDWENLTDPSNRSGWISWIRAARDSDFVHYGDKRSWRSDNEWKLHALIPGLKGRDPDHPDYPNRNDLKRLIRFLRHLKIDGLWFYAWNDYLNNDLKKNWLRGEQWAKALENTLQESSSILLKADDDSLYTVDPRDQDNTKSKIMSQRIKIDTFSEKAILAFGHFLHKGGRQLLLYQHENTKRPSLLVNSEESGQKHFPFQDETILSMSACDFSVTGSDNLLLIVQNTIDKSRKIVTVTGFKDNDLHIIVHREYKRANFYPSLLAVEDFDGDRDDDLIVAFVTSGPKAWLSFFEDPSELQQKGQTIWISTEDTGLIEQIKTGNLDPDPAHEILLLNSNPTQEWHYLDLGFIRARLRQIHDRSVMLNNVSSKHPDNLQILDIDGDRVDELLFYSQQTDSLRLSFWNLLKRENIALPVLKNSIAIPTQNHRLLPISVLE